MTEILHCGDNLNPKAIELSKKRLLLENNLFNC